MKFIVLLIGVMLLKGIELHRDMHRHGHQSKMTDPTRETKEIREIDEMTQVDETQEINKQSETGVKKNVQKEVGDDTFMPSPGSTKIESIAKYDTELVLDEVCEEKVMPKPGIIKNKLMANYRTNFRYLGMVKNGLDRVMVVMSIPIPRFENIKVKPIILRNVQKPWMVTLRMIGTLLHRYSGI